MTHLVIKCLQPSQDERTETGNQSEVPNPGSLEQTNLAKEASKYQMEERTYRPMHTIRKKALVGQLKIVELRITGCPIEVIEEGAFEDLPQLAVIHLEQTLLTQFSSNILAGNSGNNLVELRLANSPRLASIDARFLKLTKRSGHWNLPALISDTVQQSSFIIPRPISHWQKNITGEQENRMQMPREVVRLGLQRLELIGLNLNSRELINLFRDHDPTDNQTDVLLGLRQLVLHENRHPLDFPYDMFEKAPYLNRLQISECQIEDYRFLSSLHTRELILRRIKSPDAGISTSLQSTAIAKHFQLWRYTRLAESIVHLDLSESEWTGELLAVSRFNSKSPSPSTYKVSPSISDNSIINANSHVRRIELTEMPHLERLNIAGNRVLEINLDLVNRMASNWLPKLRWLDLRANQLTSLAWLWDASTEARRHLTGGSLDELGFQIQSGYIGSGRRRFGDAAEVRVQQDRPLQLHLSGNPIHCNCELANLAAAAAEAKIGLTWLRQVPCTTLTVRSRGLMGNQAMQMAAHEGTTLADWQNWRQAYVGVSTPANKSIPMVNSLKLENQEKKLVEELACLAPSPPRLTIETPTNIRTIWLRQMLSRNGFYSYELDIFSRVNASISCISSGDPPPTLVWRRAKPEDDKMETELALVTTRLRGPMAPAMSAQLNLETDVKWEQQTQQILQQTWVCTATNLAGEGQAELKIIKRSKSTSEVPTQAEENLENFEPPKYQSSSFIESGAYEQGMESWPKNKVVIKTQGTESKKQITIWPRVEQVASSRIAAADGTSINRQMTASWKLVVISFSIIHGTK